ncbi:MAG: glycosyltransferase [Betaproteobacteria bacterium]
MTIRPALSILHLTDDNRGGSQRHVIDLCRSDAADIRHFVIRMSAGSLSLHDPSRNRVLVLDLNPDAGAAASTLSTVIAELGIGCVHAHALRPLLAAVAAADHPLAAVPLCVTLHDLSCIDPRLFASPAPVPHADPAWIARCAPTLAAAREVIVPSAYMAQMVRAHYPKISPALIPNGIAAAPRADLPVDPPWPAGTPVFGVVGALGPHKGSDMLMRVAAALEGTSIGGVLIGYTEAQPVAGWAIPGRLYVHGPYTPDELPGLVAAYRVALAYFPNLIPESFSYALSEAWQAGVPVLVPGTGAQGDRVREAGGGWVLDDPQDAAAVAAAIARLLSADGATDLAAAAATLQTDSQRVPGLDTMRGTVEALYRAHGRRSVADPDSGWTRLRYLLRGQLAGGIDDVALDAEWPALVRETRTLREWNGKLTGDVAHLKGGTRKLQGDLQACNDRALVLESDIATLKARNVRVEADAAALKARTEQLETEAALIAIDLEPERRAPLTLRNAQLEDAVRDLREWTRHIEADTAELRRRNLQLDGDVIGLTRRNLELETDIVALKERNTLVEADLFALSQRNARIERDAVLLQGELGAARERLARSDQQLTALESRAAQSEQALHRLPSLLQNWLLRHAR